MIHAFACTLARVSPCPLRSVLLHGVKKNKPSQCLNTTPGFVSKLQRVRQASKFGTFSEYVHLFQTRSGHWGVIFTPFAHSSCPAQLASLPECANVASRFLAHHRCEGLSPALRLCLACTWRLFLIRRRHQSCLIRKVGKNFRQPSEQHVGSAKLHVSLFEFAARFAKSRPIRSKITVSQRYDAKAHFVHEWRRWENTLGEGSIMQWEQQGCEVL